MRVVKAQKLETVDRILGGGGFVGWGVDEIWVISRYSDKCTEKKYIRSTSTYGGFEFSRPEGYIRASCA